MENNKHFVTISKIVTAPMSKGDQVRALRDLATKCPIQAAEALEVARKIERDLFITA